MEAKTAMTSPAEPGERACAFLKVNQRPGKPRSRGVTEIRGPYYTPMGKRYLEDVLETMGRWIDTLKFAGGSFSLMPRKAVRELIDQCHRHRVAVSTGGFIEHVVTLGASAVDRYLGECKDLGFDIVEVIRYVAASDKPIDDGHVIADLSGPRFRASVQESPARFAGSPMHNPYGRLKLVNFKEIVENN